MEEHSAISERILAKVEDYEEIARSFVTTTSASMAWVIPIDSKAMRFR